ncbi:MAG: hypothetical protein JW862_13825, partial [Anaerolineales bacterium]|nr:hypothetical protein [Anaerolineales bacterium]
MKKRNILGLVGLILLSFVWVLSACQNKETPAVATETSAQSQPADPQEQAPTNTATLASTEPPPTETPLPPTETLAPTAVPDTAVPEPTGPQALPPDPQEILFQAEDGQELVGRYYPAATNPAPMVVLMHWAGGDQEDWNEIAFWLQNRGLSGTSPNLGTQPWLDPSWFPEIDASSSYAVFTFTFRDCDGGCRNFMANRSLWLLDAVAAVETARQLEGVDPERLVAMGASIGADGAIDGCFHAGAEEDVRCESALSLSPGSYLTVIYAEAVTWAEQAGKPVLCYFSGGDGEAALACLSGSGELYETFEWQGTAHGMALLTPD